MAKHYINGRHSVKVEAILKEIEGDNLKGEAKLCRVLLLLYAALGKADEVGRVWKVCEESSPQLEDCAAAIKAWGKLNRLEEAESAFELMEQKWGKQNLISSRQYSAMLNVYANNKMLKKGKRPGQENDRKRVQDGSFNLECNGEAVRGSRTSRESRQIAAHGGPQEQDAGDVQRVHDDPGLLLRERGCP
ncbi:Pentatricopeptide repeat-containing protein At1g80270, mitochondrial [Linum perenne]